MILRGAHEAIVLPVHKGQCGHLAPCHEFLDDKLIAGRTKLLVQHDRAHAFLRFLQRIADQNPLSECKTVCLQNNRKLCRLQIRDGSIRIRKGLISCRGNSVFFHKVLGKCLAAFNDGCIFPGSEDLKARCLKRIYDSGTQRIVLTAYRKINLLLLCKCNQAVKLHDTDRCTLCNPRNSGISRCAVKLLDPL